MFHSSHHDQSHSSTLGSTLRNASVRSLCRIVGLMAAFASASSVLAQNPPDAPRSATPFVRPTQYHLLPPIYQPQVDRVPTVADLVPVLDDSTLLRLSSGPVRDKRSNTGENTTDDWPYTEASHGRGRIGPIAEMPARIGAFRPARIPSKYATSDSGVQQVHYQQSSDQSQFDAANQTADDFAVAPALFEAVSSPFVNQPVQHLVSPVWEDEPSDINPWTDDHRETEVRMVSYADRSPIPDPAMTAFPATQSSTSQPPEASFSGNAMSISAPYGPEIHAAGCPCDLCQSGSSVSPDMLFGSQPSSVSFGRKTTLQIEGLVWWSNSSSLPALATTSPSGTPLDAAGILGSGNTTSVFGDSAFNESAPGFRIQVDHDLEGYGGIDFEFLQLGTRSENLTASSNEYSILARPFTDFPTGVESASVIAFPGSGAGSIQVQMDSRFRTLAAHYYQQAIAESSRLTDDQLVARFQVGPRVASLQEDFWSKDHSFDLINNSVQQRTDSLSTENLFVGGEVGMSLNRQFHYVDLSAGLSLAMGATRQKFQSSGSSVFTDFNGQTSQSDSGFLATSAGSGDVNRHRFSFIPSADFQIGIQLGAGWKFSVGYDVMLWTNALRVTDQISTQLDTRIGGDPLSTIRPFATLKDDSFLAHGISFGVERSW